MSVDGAKADITTRKAKHEKGFNSSARKFVGITTMKFVAAMSPGRDLGPRATLGRREKKGGFRKHSGI